MQMKRSAWDDVCGIWESSKGRCRIYWDDQKEQCTYEEILWGGSCRLLGLLTSRSKECVWEFRVSVQDGIEDNAPQHVGSIRLELLSSSHPSLHIQVWLEDEDAEWQPPVLLRLVRRREKFTQKERALRKRYSRGRGTWSCESPTSTMDYSNVILEVSNEIPLKPSGKGKGSGDHNIEHDRNGPLRNTLQTPLESILWLVPGVPRRCGAGMEVGSVSCRGSPLTIDDDRIEARCSEGCVSSFHARCYQKLMRRRGAKCLCEDCHGEIVIARRVRGDSSVCAEINHFESPPPDVRPEIASNLPRVHADLFHSLLEEANHPEPSDSLEEHSNSLQMALDLTSEARRGETNPDEDKYLRDVLSSSPCHETHPVLHDHIDSIEDIQSFYLVEVIPSEDLDTPEGKIKQKRTKLLSSQKLRRRQLKTDKATFQHMFTAEKVDRKNELEFVPDVTPECQASLLAIPTPTVLDSVQAKVKNRWGREGLAPPNSDGMASPPQARPGGLPQAVVTAALSPERFPQHVARGLICSKDVIKALQGTWANVLDNSEKYQVIGLEVLRRKAGITKKFPLRWNNEYGWVEWGLGKYYLQHPETLPLRIARWFASDAGSRSFSWNRDAREDELVPNTDRVLPHIATPVVRRQPLTQLPTQLSSIPARGFVNVHRASFPNPTSHAQQHILQESLQDEIDKLNQSEFEQPASSCASTEEPLQDETDKLSQSEYEQPSSSGVHEDSPTKIRSWPVYKHPTTGQRWRCNPDQPDDFFFEDDATWKRFKHVLDTGVVRYWWWHESTSRVVFEEEAG